MQKIITITVFSLLFLFSSTTTFTKSYDDAAGKFNEVLVFLKSIDDEIKQVELILEEQGAPYTPGRFPAWKKK